MTEIIDEYEILLKKKCIRVEVHIQDTFIQGDRKYLKIVITNFISNAIKHCFKNGKIVVCIDQGCFIYNEGDLIKEEQLENIWYSFVTHDQEGSGLGLAICRSILELHQMTYGVENKEHSVMFYFYQKS